jgi:uncharacterized protein YbaP (TraB family)
MLAACLLIALAACGAAKAPPAEPAKVALWAITDGTGVHGWLLGTVHSLPPGTQWRRPAIDKAIEKAGDAIKAAGEKKGSTSSRPPAAARRPSQIGAKASERATASSRWPVTASSAAHAWLWRA